MSNWQLYLQLNRDIGALIAMLGDSDLSPTDRETLKNIADRMDDTDAQLQNALKDRTPR